LPGGAIAEVEGREESVVGEYVTESAARTDAAGTSASIIDKLNADRIPGDANESMVAESPE